MGPDPNPLGTSDEIRTPARMALIPAWLLPTLPDSSCASRSFRVDVICCRHVTPGAAKAGPMPTDQRLGPDDRENLQD